MLFIVYFIIGTPTIFVFKNIVYKNRTVIHLKNYNMQTIKCILSHLKFIMLKKMHEIKLAMFHII